MMQTQFKQLKGCTDHILFRYEGKLYYKIPLLYYIDYNNSAEVFNAIDAETGEIVWFDGLRKVEVIAQ